MKNIVKLLNLTTALTVSIMASDSPSQAEETQTCFVVEHEKKPEIGKEEDDQAVVDEKKDIIDQEGVGANTQVAEEDEDSLDFLGQEDYAELAAGGDSSVVLEGAPHGEIFKVQGAASPAAEELVLTPLSEKQKNCLKHFFKTKKIVSYADVKENWSAYFSHMNGIIDNLMKQNGDTDTLGEKQATLLKCDTLMRNIEKAIFEMVQKKYGSHNN